MKARLTRRQLVPLAAVAAYVVAGCLVYDTSAAAPLASSGLLGQSAVLSHVLEAPKAARPLPATHVKTASILSVAPDAGSYRNNDPNIVPLLASFSRSPRIALPHTVTPQPVVLESYTPTEVVGITNSSGTTVRAPQSASDTSIAPNTPLTFTVRVNNDSASTQATAVYIQIKDPDSIYDDTNLHGNPREHKVFAEDGYTRNNMPSANNPTGGGAVSGSNPTQNATPGATGFGNTPADTTLDPEANTSGSASSEIYNGYGNFGGYTDNFAQLPYQAFPQTGGGNIDYHQRGVVGGHDTAQPVTEFVTLGRVDFQDWGSRNPIYQAGPNNSRIEFPGPDPGDADNPGVSNGPTDYGTFRVVGQEYECQYLKAYNATGANANTSTNPAGYTGTNGNPGEGGSAVDAADSDYGDPYYLAGVDDQAAGSFNPSTTPRPEWLKLNPVSGQPDLYSATWVSPISPSDYYLDVIVADNANNWRIYDNVWGFSTQTFQANNDILLVMDNALGQKYAAAALSSNGGLVNLRPQFYGAESSFTSTDVRQLPNASLAYFGASTPSSIYLPPNTPATSASPNPVNTTNAQGGYPIISFLGFEPGFLPSELPESGLGYNSYSGDSIVDRETILANGPNVSDPGLDYPLGPVSYPKSQGYSLWRILSRGPVPSSLLTTPASSGGYGPDASANQPAVQDPTGPQYPAADGNASPLVPVSPRCVVWVSPFTGEQPLNVPGSLADSTTQAELQQFVASGGRLFITGQEVATDLTHEGNTAFLNNVLNVNFTSDGNGADNQTIAGQNSIDHFISFDSLFDFQAPPTFDDVYSNFFQNLLNNLLPIYSPPAAAPLIISNNYGRNVAPATYDFWRTDGSLTDMGPYVTQYGSSNASVQSQISEVTPINGATEDMSIGSAGGATVGGPAGLVWHIDNTDAVGSGFGSRVVFASFGMQALSQDIYHVYDTPSKTDYYFSHNQRTNVLHNIVSFLRTGTYTGQIFQGTGNNVGVAGATVYLIPFPNTSASHVIPGQTRQTYSALTSDGTDGNPVGYYNIQGVVPGAYRVIAYKNGYTRAVSPVNNETANTFSVAGDTTCVVNLNIIPVPPASVTGTVKFANGTNATYQNNGATVTFSAPGNTSIGPIQVGTDGTYTAPVPPGTWTVQATSTSPAGTSLTQQIVVTTAGASGVNLVININPAVVHGLVTDGTTGISGATVAFLSTNPAIVVPTTTTGAGGTYTSPGLPDGSYTITAGKTGYVVTQTASITVSGGVSTPATPSNVILQAVPVNPVTISGNVSSLAGATTPSQPIPNATITVTDLAGNTITTTPSPIITDGSGNYTASVLEGQYNITASATGYTSASQTVTVTGNRPNLNFQLNALTAAQSFIGGKFHMISWPYDYQPSGVSAFDQIFGALASHDSNGNLIGNRSHAYSYDADISNYVTDPAFPADGLRPGYGYFIYLYNSVSAYTGSIQGSPVISPVTVPLKKGWNIIGVPSTSAISVANLSVLINGSDYTFSQSVNLLHALSGTLYSYNPALPPSAPYVAVTGSGSLEPFQGYWLYASVPNLDLVIPNG